MITLKESASDKLLSALELGEAGIAMMRQNLKRRWPDESADQVDSRLQTWLQTRPTSQFGDGPKTLILRTPR